MTASPRVLRSRCADPLLFVTTEDSPAKCFGVLEETILRTTPFSGKPSSTATIRAPFSSEKAGKSPTSSSSESRALLGTPRAEAAFSLSYLPR